MTDVAIVGATRTPIGNFGGALAGVQAPLLGQIVIHSALKRADVSPEDVDEVIMGQVLSAGCGQNITRQAAINAGIPQDKPAMTINQLCGSGLRSVALGAQSIICGNTSIVVAGGVENMSQAPHVSYLRSGIKIGEARFQDSMLVDGLMDAFNGYHMGNTAENVAKQWKLSREELDAFAADSQQKAEAAQKASKFTDEITPVTLRTKKGEISFDTDEYPRHGTTAESLGKLPPVFDKDGIVTAGNASGINDGAAAVVLMKADEAKKRKIKPMAIIKSFASVGVDPAIMGTGPIPASRKALEKADWSVDDLDLIEANEAFAAQAIAVNRDMGWDTDKVNVNGGAIALGHPIGASGCRVLTTLLFEMKRRKSKKGIATLCIGGGMGIAMCLEAS